MIISALVTRFQWIPKQTPLTKTEELSNSERQTAVNRSIISPFTAADTR